MSFSKFTRRQVTENLEDTAKTFSSKLKNIKVLAFDVDGILTNGLIWYGGKDVGWNRCFNVRDGHMMKEMMKQGYKVGVITGGNSQSIYRRFGKESDGLNLDFIFAGSEDKRQHYETIKQWGFTDEEILYMGDEFFDLPILKNCGFSATVAQASNEIRKAVDYVTQTPAGLGAAREVMDMLHYACHQT